MAVRPSFISADVKRSRPGPWQIFTRNLIVQMCLGLIWKERQSFTDIWFIDSKKFKTIQRLRLKNIQTCSSITRPASSKSIREDFFIVPTLILRPPNFRSRYLFEKVGQKEKVWKSWSERKSLQKSVRKKISLPICDEDGFYLSIVCTASGPCKRALAQVFVRADVSSLITWSSVSIDLNQSETNPENSVRMLTLNE